MSESVEPVSLDEFALVARSFLDAHVPRKPAERASTWGSGSDGVGLFEARTPEQQSNLLALGRVWRATKFDHGFGWLSGPVEHGGAGLSPAHERLWRALESEYDVPEQDLFGVGLGMVGPTLAAHGGPETLKYVRRIYRGDVVACQLFSEPAAGSDLAALECRAERDGDEWVVNGQKVWTSSAQFADIGLLLARTDWHAPKHRGITAFVVDMKAPGVEVRPLRQMNGNANFNEVFFTDARIRDDHRLGDENNGWNVSMTTLGNERASIGANRTVWHLVERMIEMVRHFGLERDPVVRNALADLVVQFKVAEYSNMRAMANVNAGHPPGAEMAMAKSAGIMNLRRIADFASHVLGPRMIADTGEWGTWVWGNFVLGVPGQRIGGGTDEVMKNVAGERVLGLPKEPFSDAKVPFDERRRAQQGS